MQKIKCMFCSKVTKPIKKTVRKKINEKTVTLTNAVVNFCSDCNEIFVSPETQNAITHIRENKLTEKSIIFDCHELLSKI